MNEYKLLLVDDSPLNLQILAEILQEKDYSLALSSNGNDAYEYAIKNKPHLILLDIMMPEMDGFEVCEKLKKNDITKKIPIIFITAKADDESIEKGFQLGAVDYITKPFKKFELLSRIHTQFELKMYQDGLEKKVAEKTLELKQANSKLLKLEKAKSDFLTLISHELNTPISTIKTITSLLQKKIDFPGGDELLEKLNSSTERLKRFSDIALLITSLQVENMQLVIKKISSDSFFQNEIDKVKTKLSSKNIKIIINNSAPLINGDINLLSKALSILLGKAIQYSPENSTISLISNTIDNNYRISICDEGPGFTKNALKQLFEFFSVEDISHHTEGLGLSIATVQMIMQLHGGTIKIVNNNTKGATVSLLIPNEEVS